MSDKQTGKLFMVNFPFQLNHTGLRSESASLSPDSQSSISRTFFYHEDGSRNFLRNVDFYV